MTDSRESETEEDRTKGVDILPPFLLWRVQSKVRTTHYTYLGLPVTILFRYIDNGVITSSMASNSTYFDVKQELLVSVRLTLLLTRVPVEELENLSKRLPSTYVDMIKDCRIPKDTNEKN